MSLHKVYHHFSLLNLSSPPFLPLLHHLPKPLSSSPSLSIKSARSPPIRSHSRPTVKSIKAMSASRFHNLVPINAVAAEGGSGSNGSLSSSSSSSTAAATTTVDYEGTEEVVNLDFSLNFIEDIFQVELFDSESYFER